MSQQLTGETTELLQAMIRNACVNDGTPDSGEEIRNVDLLTTFLEGSGLIFNVLSLIPVEHRLSHALRGATPTPLKLCLGSHRRCTCEP